MALDWFAGSSARPRMRSIQGPSACWAMRGVAVVHRAARIRVERSGRMVQLLGWGTPRGCRRIGAARSPANPHEHWESGRFLSRWSRGTPAANTGPFGRNSPGPRVPSLVSRLPLLSSARPQPERDRMAGSSEYTGVDFYDMDSLLSEEERAVRDTVRQWVTEALIPVIGPAYIEGRFPKEL